MKIEFSAKVPQGRREAIRVLPFFNDAGVEHLPSLLRAALEGKPQHIAVEAFTKEGRFIAIRLGERGICTQKGLEEAGAALIKKAAEGRETSLILDVSLLDLEGVDLLCGMLLASWRFDKYRTAVKSEEKSSIKHCLVLCKDPVSLERYF